MEQLESLDICLVEHEGKALEEYLLQMFQRQNKNLKHLTLTITMTWEVIDTLMRAIDQSRLLLESLRLKAHYFHPVHSQIRNVFEN